MRVYLPATLPGLAGLLRKAEIGPAPLRAFSVTPALREWYASGDEEELEYVALMHAARASLRLLAADPDAPRRRVVLAADLPEQQVGQSWQRRGQVDAHIRGPVPRRRNARSGARPRGDPSLPPPAPGGTDFAGDNFPAASAAVTAAIASASGTCSQIRTTRHPAAVSAASAARSRSTVRRSFGAQYHSLTAGLRPCSGQACQKHPSTKTATRRAVNAISGRTRVPAARSSR